MCRWPHDGSRLAASSSRLENRSCRSFSLRTSAYAHIIFCVVNFISVFVAGRPESNRGILSTFFRLVSLSHTSQSISKLIDNTNIEAQNNPFKVIFSYLF